MYIDAVGIAWLVFVVFCVGYFYHRYGSERNPDRDRGGSKWMKTVTRLLKKWGS